VADGSIRALKTLEKFSGTSFSPDGRYIALDAPQAGDPFKRDVFILSTEERHEIPLVVHPAHDRVFGWTPNGKAVLFASDRTGSEAIWMIQVADGRAHGTPEMIRTGSSRTMPLDSAGTVASSIVNRKTRRISTQSGSVRQRARFLDHRSGSSIDSRDPIPIRVTRRTGSTWPIALDAVSSGRRLRATSST